VLKVELHAHTADDPQDRIAYSTTDLIDRAAALGYDALAVTLHDRQLDLEPFRAHAEQRGIILIPGIERTIEGKHVLLLNFQSGAESVRTFDDLAALKRREHGLVVAPHPFFPGSSPLRGQLTRHAHLFDAVEYNAMFTRAVNFNRIGEWWAREHGKPMVGNGDVHLLEQLGSTYSLVDAERCPDAICDAVARGHVKVVATPHSAIRAAWLFTRLTVGTAIPSRPADQLTLEGAASR
jgi:predicted metal-dependent phosphoesterase TrpH